jgi:hypothetical protein
MEQVEDQILQIPEIVRKVDEILLHKSQEAIEAFQINLED